MIFDTEGSEPDVTIEDCKQKCLEEANCKFMFFGNEVFCAKYFDAETCVLMVNRCALFETCDSRTAYAGNDPTVFRRPFTGNYNNLKF